MNKKFEASKKLTKADGTIAYVWEGKLHNWEGPALIPGGDNRKREYHIHGIQYTEENWKRDLNSDIKMVEKYKQMKMIYDLNKIIVVDIFGKILDSDSVNINLYMKEFENIRNYSNLQLAEIYKYYGTKVYTYNERYSLE